jgi:hypothetical protein
MNIIFVTDTMQECNDSTVRILGACIVSPKIESGIKMLILKEGIKIL